MKFSTVNTSLNTICAYNTMFPLEFPLGTLKRNAQENDVVLDPFCGRGTTNFAARLKGLKTVGIDSSPVASAIAAAKLADTSPDEILTAFDETLDEVAIPNETPDSEFWEWAYHREVLTTICRVRQSLLLNCDTDARIALRAIMLGALHGHLAKTKEANFSNQCQRTYSPKPAYAVRFWSSKGIKPPKVDVRGIVRERAIRYFQTKIPRVEGEIIRGDSRDALLFNLVANKWNGQFNWVITSPPYYGMRSYLPDQWLRLWFIGGPPIVDYSQIGQLPHKGIAEFTRELRHVWNNVRHVCTDTCRMVVRFGGLPSVKSDPPQILRESLENTGWEIYHKRSAGFSTQGQRQAYQQAKNRNPPVEEYDYWLRLT